MIVVVLLIVGIVCLAVGVHLEARGRGCTKIEQGPDRTV